MIHNQMALCTIGCDVILERLEYSCFLSGSECLFQMGLFVQLKLL